MIVVVLVLCLAFMSAKMASVKIKILSKLRLSLRLKTIDLYRQARLEPHDAESRRVTRLVASPNLVEILELGML